MSDRTDGEPRACPATGPDPASRRLALDTTVMATLLGVILVISVAANPGQWLVKCAGAQPWGLPGRVVFFLAATHLVMFSFGVRRGADLRRELAERRAAQAQLRYLADHDDLTGLPNRARFVRTLSEWLAADVPAAVAVIDLDRFKEINDTLGHHIGDAVLQEVAAGMAAATPPAGLLARLGGDEFALLLPEPDHTTAHDMVHGVLGAIRAPVQTAGLTLAIEASAGIACAPDHGTGSAELLRRADLAMYAAKSDRLGVQEFTTELDGGGTGRHRLHGDLTRALSATARPGTCRTTPYRRG
ncbi:MAG TPA: GGDEF domain-containing protein [Kineosporiaceae bacterium]